MRAFTLLATSLVALGAHATSNHAAFHNNLVARTAINPHLVCGDNFVDCNNGFCCKSGSTCATSQSVPVCKTGDNNYVIALPYDDTALASASSALNAVVASLTASTSSSSSVATTTSSSSAASSTATPSSTAYGYGYNATTGYIPSATAPYPTGGYSGGHASGTGVATAAYPTSTFTGAAVAVRGELGALGVVGLVGMLNLLW